MPLEPHTESNGIDEASEFNFARGCGCTLLFVLIPLTLMGVWGVARRSPSSDPIGQHDRNESP